MPFGFFKKKTEEPKSSGSHYHELTVREVIQETPDAVSLVFEQMQPPLTYKSGQFLTLIFNLEGQEVRRAYSLCSSPITDAYPAVAIKRVDQGLVSNHIADTVRAGDKVKVMDSTGNFTIDIASGSVRHLVLFSGGSGITPMLSLIKTLLATEKDSQCSLIYSNRNETSIIFKRTLDALQAEHNHRFRVFYLLDDAPAEWKGYSGFLNESILNDIFTKLPSLTPEQTSYLMCGPEAMMKNVESLLMARGITKDKIRHESFKQGLSEKKFEPAPSGGSAQAHEVVIRYDGQEHKVKVEAGKTILETALAQGIDLPYSCQSGLCTACRGKAISGKVKLDEEDGLSKSELEEGYVLTCVGHPLTDDVVIEIG